MVYSKHIQKSKKSWFFSDLKYVLPCLFLLGCVYYLVEKQDDALNNCLNNGYTLNHCNDVLNKESN